jgi:hypothetical protein
MKNLLISLTFKKTFSSMFDIIPRKGKNLFLFAALLLLAGCITLPPIQHKIKTEEVYSVRYGAIWKLASDSAVRTIADVKKADKKSGLIRTKEFRAPYKGFQYISEYADCGEPGGMYVYRGIIGYFDIVVSEKGEDKVSVTANAHYRAPMWKGSSFRGMVVCQSRGHVEKLFFQNLRLSLRDYKEDEAERLENGEVSEPEDSKAAQEEQSECINILPLFRNDLFRKILPDSP